jgi:hypothetical protein
MRVRSFACSYTAVFFCLTLAQVKRWRHCFGFSWTFCPGFRPQTFGSSYRKIKSENVKCVSRMNYGQQLLVSRVMPWGSFTLRQSPSSDPWSQLQANAHLLDDHAYIPLYCKSWFQDNNRLCHIHLYSNILH